MCWRLLLTSSILLHTARFNVALLLNITPDHLDRHGDMEGYVAAKMHIFERQQAADTAVIAVDDEYTKNNWQVASCKLQKPPKCRRIRISRTRDLCEGRRHDGTLRFDLQLRSYPLSRPLTGRHNWQNAAAAYAAARAVGVAPDIIYKAMQSFPGLRHRLQLVATIRGVRFINDSKATNADATSNALAPYNNIYWILGGKPKAGGIETLGEYFPKIAHAFLIGEAEEEFAKTLEGKAPYTRCGTLENGAGKRGGAGVCRRKKDAVVLLSPACASFDQFKNFEERGDAFRALVETLAARKDLNAL